MKTPSRSAPISLLLLLWAFGLLLSGWAPKDRLTWWLEIFPVLIAAPLLWFTRNRFPLPRYLYGWIALHGIVLMVGGHYTYAEVPLGEWAKEVFSFSRNHFDRLGHLFQGFVPALLVREVLARKGVVRGKVWRFFLTLTVCMAVSMAYEFIEWWSALILGQGADAFLGSQGDPWDTQWDMFFATVGAILAQLVYRDPMPEA